MGNYYYIDDKKSEIVLSPEMLIDELQEEPEIDKKIIFKKPRGINTRSRR